MKKGIVSVISTIVGAAAGAGAAGTIKDKEVKKWKDYSNKHLALYKMMCKWVEVKQDGKNLSVYFENNGYKKIAIYGMSFAGEVLLEELGGTGIEVAYGIDRNADRLFADIDIVSADDDLEPVDVIVVTPITFFDEIEENLSEKVSCPVISLEDILDEV